MANQKLRAPDFEYIAAHRAEMSERELAEAIGVSKTTVHRAIKRLGITAAGSAPAAPPQVPQEAPSEAPDRLVRLKRLAAALDRAMCEATPSALPAVAKEYRATLEEIASIDAAGDAPRAEPAQEKKEAKVTAFSVIRSSRAPLGEAAEV